MSCLTGPNFGFIFASFDEGAQCREAKFRCHLGIGQPAICTLHGQIDCYGSTHVADLDEASVGHPNLVRHIDVELPVEVVGRNHSEFPALAQGATLVAGLGQYSAKADSRPARPWKFPRAQIARPSLHLFGQNSGLKQIHGSVHLKIPHRPQHSHIFTLRKRSAFRTTDIDDRLITTAAKIGLTRMPVNG
jgi:hypothetical protein